MSDGYDDLAETVRTVELLLSQTGLDRDSALPLQELSFHTSFSQEDLQTLLAGERLPEPESFDHEVVRRIKYLQATRLNETEGPGGTLESRRYSHAQIARACNMTPAWLSNLLGKPKAPNLDHSAQLAAFFNVPVTFLTDPPAAALNRVLNDRTIPQMRHFAQSPTEAIRNRHAVKIAHRLGDTDLSPEQEAALMLLVDAVARTTEGAGRG
ncbi:helix-turn-helix domain-containing protein [Streptomyces sp. NPDC059835]|uniref:helix-turn-helix domain-containing protein n=1 Tax=Streptomyces sp. NPDC059835 TaxID=3346967 RepID=UPI00364EC888